MSRPKGLAPPPKVHKSSASFVGFCWIPDEILVPENSQKEPLGAAIELTPLAYLLLLGELRTLSYLFVFFKSRGVYDLPCAGKKIARFIKVLIKEAQLIKQSWGKPGSHRRVEWDDLSALSSPPYPTLSLVSHQHSIFSCISDFPSHLSFSRVVLKPNFNLLG